MTFLWHLFLAARQAFANWRTQRHVDLSRAWSATAVDAQQRIGR